MKKRTTATRAEAAAIHKRPKLPSGAEPMTVEPSHDAPAPSSPCKAVIVEKRTMLMKALDRVR
jgi:hypothetical protein